MRARAEAGPKFPNKRLEPDLGSEAPRSRYAVLDEEGGLPWHLAGVGCRPLLQHKTMPEDYQQRAGVGVEAEVGRGIEGCIACNVRGQTNPDVLGVGAGREHEADFAESTLDLKAHVWRVELGHSSARNGPLAEQPCTNADGALHVLTSPGVDVLGRA